MRPPLKKRSWIRIGPYGQPSILTKTTSIPLIITRCLLPTKWNAFIVSTVDSASSSTVSVVSLRQAHQPFRSSHFDKLINRLGRLTSTSSLRQAHQPFRSSHFDKLTSTSSVSNLRTLRTLRTPSLSRWPKWHEQNNRYEKRLYLHIKMRKWQFLYGQHHWFGAQATPASAG